MDSTFPPGGDAESKPRPEATPLDLLVWSMAVAARDVLRVELRSASGAPLPPFTPGAHIALQWPGGPARSYSLINRAADRTRYVIAVQRDSRSRGGSVHVHERLRVGDTVAVAAPANHFALAEDAQASVLIAGGIGITPLWAMAQRLEELGRPWELHYAARSPAHAPLLDEAMALGAASRRGRVATYFSQVAGTQAPARLPVAAVVGAAPPGAHLYCCGPERLIDAFSEASAARDPRTVHVERFAPALPANTDGGFSVRLARSGGEIPIPPGLSILRALIARGIHVNHSCEQGVCGSCEVRVLEGEPAHRDSILTEAEQAAGKTMMVCCSGARTPTLVLDL